MDSRATNYLAFEDNVGLPFNSDGIVNSQRVAFIEFLGKDEFEEIFGIDNSEDIKLYKKVKSLGMINDDGTPNDDGIKTFFDDACKSVAIEVLGEDEYYRRHGLKNPNSKETTSEKIKVLFSNKSHIYQIWNKIRKSVKV
jgi:hypothetical protein